MVPDMDRIEDSITLMHEAISDYVEHFHSKEDVEQAIKEDMGVMGYDYKIDWREAHELDFLLPEEKVDKVELYILTVMFSVGGQYVTMEFFYWD